MPAPHLATDKRSVDHNGHMRVPGCRISKATVNTYYGREIPGFEALGLDATRVYLMYRDPNELRLAASTFDAVPLLDVHVPVTADSHEFESTVGVISNTRFDYPYLIGDVTVWTQDAINLITTEEQRELSSAYLYTPEMKPGLSPEGLRYDGVMRNLRGNHVALVAEGRAGPDVMVADGKPHTMKFPNFFSKLAALFPTPPDAAGLVALDGALAAELEAMDAGLSDEERKAACDALAKELSKDAESLSDEEKTEAFRRAAADKRAKDAAGPGVAAAPNAPVGGAPKPSMDEAAVEARVATAVAAAREGYVLATDTVLKPDAERLATDAAAIVHALYAAREAVAERTGLVNIAEYKTAEAVYRYALDKLSVSHKDTPAVALAELYTASTRTAAVVTIDAAPFNTAEMFGGLKLISRG